MERSRVAIAPAEARGSATSSAVAQMVSTSTSSVPLLHATTTAPTSGGSRSVDALSSGHLRTSAAPASMVSHILSSESVWSLSSLDEAPGTALPSNLATATSSPASTNQSPLLTLINHNRPVQITLGILIMLVVIMPLFTACYRKRRRKPDVETGVAPVSPPPFRLRFHGLASLRSHRRFAKARKLEEISVSTTESRTGTLEDMRESREEHQVIAISLRHKASNGSMLSEIEVPEPVWKGKGRDIAW